ncbi:MAG: dTDP-glucose 4,6-dehydratase, partial [Thermoplasmatales archaeon]
IRYWNKKHSGDEVINVDKITYASNHLVEKEFANVPNYTFLKADINDYEALKAIVKDSDLIVNFAAESHVDNSIAAPDQFIKSNILGVYSLLKIALQTGIRFHQVSTDEVYGSLSLKSKARFSETSRYDPRNPYSATKASADFLVRAFANTYRLPLTISNCSNNYGPYQHPEKLVPKAILNALRYKEIPIYGSGRQIRDWIYVEDHCSAIELITKKGEPGKTYLVGGDGETTNLEIVGLILNKLGRSEDLIKFVKDRPGHDLRYAIKTSNALRKLGWKKSTDIDNGLKTTIDHYVFNQDYYYPLMKN